METSLSYLKQFGVSKKEAKDLASSLATEIKEGRVDPLEVQATISFFENFIKEFKKDEEIEEITVSEAQKYGKEFDHLNGKFQIREVGVKYDYSVCNYTPYENAKEEADYWNSKKKEAENYLKSLKSQTPDRDTGEVINPPARSSKTKAIFTLNK